MVRIVFEEKFMIFYIMICKVPGNWIVCVGGVVFGEFLNVLELIEGDYLFVIYFLCEDIVIVFLDESDKIIYCLYKGDVWYFLIVIKSKIFVDVVWSYEDLKEDVVCIKDYLVFYISDELMVE